MIYLTTILVGLVVAVPLGGLAFVVCTDFNPDPADDAASYDAMRALQGRVAGYNSASPHGGSLTVDDLRAERKNLNGLWRWANALEDRRARKAYRGWITYYQNNLNRCWAEFDKVEARKGARPAMPLPPPRA